MFYNIDFFPYSALLSFRSHAFFKGLCIFCVQLYTYSSK